ncbi:ABC transporter permease [Thalassotalea maritima]|uniref:ABC transporter permease n=1 Tax=Thalassotalea maritima TaxID=3242416 RepID=UPI003527533E
MWQVFIKELVELLRDKKTLFFIIALPLFIFPVIFALMGFLSAKVAISEHEKVVRYVIVNKHAVNDFAESLFYHSDFKEVEASLTNEQDYKDAIKNDQLDLVIVFNDEFAKNIASGKQSTWQIYLNGSKVIGGARGKLEEVLAEYVDSLQRTQFEELGQTDAQFLAFKKPIVLQEIDTAEQRESVGEKLGGLIPYLLIPLCLTGAMYPAIDVGAGEKERGTIETLLLTPVSRYHLVLGKFLCILTTAIMTAMITMLSMVLWTFLFGQILSVEQISQVLGSVGAFEYLMVVLLLLPVCAIFSALLLAISIYASSYKEAQNYMGPLTIIGILPVIVGMMPGMKLDATWALVPISNVALAIKELFKGTLDMAYLFPIFASTGIIALISIVFCVHWFNRESVLFR